MYRYNDPESIEYRDRGLGDPTQSLKSFYREREQLEFNERGLGSLDDYSNNKNEEGSEREC